MLERRVYRWLERRVERVLNDGGMQNGRPRKIDRFRCSPKLGFACVRHRSGKF